MGEKSTTVGINSIANNLSSHVVATYTYKRALTGNWSEQAYIKSKNSGQDDNFGAAVSISLDGNTIAIGANNEDSLANESTTNSGAVYLY